MEQNAQAQAKPIKIPGPEHPISVERNSSRVVVSVAGRVIADTREALTLREAHYPAVQYDAVWTYETPYARAIRSSGVWRRAAGTRPR